MSQKNVELVRRANAAYAAGGMDAALPFFADDTVLYSIPEWPDDPEYHGHDGLRRLDRQWRDNFDDFGFEAQEIHDAGASVVSLHSLTGRTKESGVPMAMQIGAVITGFADGRIGAQRLFPSWEAALEAAGLEESAMSQENVESVRQWLEAISGGGEDFDRALALVHPDIVFVPPGDQPPYRGAERLRRWMEPDAFQEQVVKTFEPVVVTDRTILGRQLVMARGATSGIELDVVTWSVWTFDENGLITRIELFLDHEEDKALEAAGLRE